MKRIVMAAVFLLGSMSGARPSIAADAKHAPKKSKAATKPATPAPAPAPLPAIPPKPAPAPQPPPSSDEERGGRIYSTGR